jgi:hypothetical protein
VTSPPTHECNNSTATFACNRGAMFYTLSVSRCYKQDKLVSEIVRQERVLRQSVGWWVSELDSSWGSAVVSCCCEKLYMRPGTIWECRERGTSAIASRYQATVNKDSDRPRNEQNSESITRTYSYKLNECTVSQIVNPNLVCSQSVKRK